MANTFTQIYMQIVFAVEGRQSLIRKEFKDDLFKYMTGIVQERGHKLISINGMPDHVHLLVGQQPKVALSDLVRDIKAFSSKHVNDMSWVRGRFNWQEGFGAFSYSRSQLSRVIRYIENQEIHHRKRTFRQEYLSLLKKFEIEYDERYLFKWIDPSEVKW
jgi:REP element-mobilizing transposase RayT